LKAKQFGDFAIAIVVVACGAVLFGVLLYALNGGAFAKGGPAFTALFPDVTGISVGSQVKVAGALAGRVTAVKFLDPAARQGSPAGADVIAVTFELDKSVPGLRTDSSALIAADTLLSDKFLLLTPGTVSAPELVAGSQIRGVAPVTFDQLTRQLGGLLDRLDGVASSLDKFKDLPDLIPAARATLADVSTLVQSANGAVADARVVLQEGGRFLSDNRVPLENALTKLEDAAERIDALSLRADNILKASSSDITSTVRDLRVASQNLKAASQSAKTLSGILVERPQSLLFGVPKKQE